jgi:hypothetical protein
MIAVGGRRIDVTTDAAGALDDAFEFIPRTTGFEHPGKAWLGLHHSPEFGITDFEQFKDIAHRPER